MREIVVNTFVSLDGVMQAPGTAPAGLGLVESRSFPGGAVLAEYRTGAAIEPGSFVRTNRARPSWSGAPSSRGDRR